MRFRQPAHSRAIPPAVPIGLGAADTDEAAADRLPAGVKPPLPLMRRPGPMAAPGGFGVVAVVLAVEVDDDGDGAVVWPSGDAFVAAVVIVGDNEGR